MGDLKMEKDELDELIVDENQEPNKALIRDLIKSSLTISKNGDIGFEENYFKQKETIKIIQFLLAKKVIVIKKLGKLQKEKLQPKEISESTYVNHNTVKRALTCDLKEFVKKEKEGYFIPNYNLFKIKDKFFRNKS